MNCLKQQWNILVSKQNSIERTEGHKDEMTILCGGKWMSDLFTEMIQEEFNRRITIGEDFVTWLKEEGEKVGLDPDAVQETVKEFLK